MIHICILKFPGGGTQEFADEDVNVIEEIRHHALNMKRRMSVKLDMVIFQMPLEEYKRQKDLEKTRSIEASQRILETPQVKENQT